MKIPHVGSLLCSPQHLLIRSLDPFSIMCKWTQPFRGTDCRKSSESLSSADSSSLCSAGIERARKCLQGDHFVRCCHSTYSLQGFSGVVRGGQQQFATQTLRVHLLGIQKNSRRLELSISKNTPHGRWGQGPGSVDPRFPTGLPFPVPEILEFVALRDSGNIFQQFSPSPGDDLRLRLAIRSRGQTVRSDSFWEIGCDFSAVMIRLRLRCILR